MRNVFWSILLLTLLCGVGSAATLSVDPAESTCAYGETVDLTVKVQDVNNLGGFDIDVTWNPSVAILDTEAGNVTVSPFFSAHVNNSAVCTQDGRIRVAGVNATLEGVSGSADLFTVHLKAVDDTGASTPVSLKVNNYGFLNSTSAENITVSAVTGATIKTTNQNVVDARIATASNQAIVGQENKITASVVNRRGVETSALNIEVSIVDSDGALVCEPWSYPDTIIPAWGGFQEVVTWTPPERGNYTAIINVTSDKPPAGKPTDTKTIIVKEYTLKFNSDIYGPRDNRASAGSWFSMGAYVTASQSGNAWLNITAPDYVEVYRGENQTRYLYASDWNYVRVWMKTDTPGKIAAGDIRFDIAANGKEASLNGTEVFIWVPSIRVSSVGATSVQDNGGTGELTFNTLHTNNTYDNVTKIIVQSGAQGRTLSGLDYLVGYPYGCVEQTASRMLASLNVKNYYLDRGDKPDDWADIRKRANESVEAGVTRILKTSDKGQNPDGGWSLWGRGTSESSSSSYAGYTLAKINRDENDLDRFIAVSNGTTVTDGTVNFEKLIEWYYYYPDADKWKPHSCHSWTRESNTAFVMLIHDMINQTVALDDTHRGYMEDNMKKATRHLVESIEDSSLFSGKDPAMTTGLALWGLEAFAMPSEDVTEQQITDAKVAAAEWLIESQDDDGSWPAGKSYGWYSNGRVTEATAYAILALNATGLPAENETISSGVDWLINQYEKGGGWGYTWASQVAIDALIHCQPTEVAAGTVDVRIDGVLIKTFSMDATTPRVEYPLNEEQMNTLMAGGTGTQVRPIEASGGNGEVRGHTLTAEITSGTGPILVSVDHSQSAPVNEIDGKIQGSRMIQSFGAEEEAGLLQVSTDIGILSDAPLVQEISNTYDVGITSTEMIAGEEADVTITVTSEKNIYSPMIEIPIAGFTFDNKTGIIENDNLGAFEVLNGTTGNDHPSLFIQSVGWEAGDLQTYEFKITPEDHGELDLDLRIRPLYDDTDVYLDNKTFTVMGRGNISVNVVNETGAPVDAESITLVGEDSDPIVQKNVPTHTFTNVLNGNYTLVVNGTGDHPSIRTAVRVAPDATALCNVTLPSSLTSPTLVFSEGGAGSIASVEQKPAGRLSAAYAENTTYTVTVLGDGGEIGIALEFPMRYLMNEPVVKVNGENATYELISGTFEYDCLNQTYSTTNATLIVYNTTTGSNTVEIGFDGSKFGKARRTGDVTSTDAMFVLQFVVGSRDYLDTYDYADVHSPKDRKITSTDAMYILQYVVGARDEHYNLKL